MPRRRAENRGASGTFRRQGSFPFDNLEKRRNSTMARYLDSSDGNVRMRREQDDPPVTLSATEARQGSWGRPVFYVLVGGLILAMVAWWGAEYYGAAIAPPTDPSTTSSTTTAPAADPKLLDDNQPKGQPVQKAPAIQDSTKM
jgi:hypothetical protein